MSYFGNYGGYGSYGGYGGYGYDGGYSNYGIYDPTGYTANYADTTLEEIIVVGHRPNYAVPQYYIQDVSYTPSGGGGGGGGDQGSHDEEVANLISKVEGGLKAIIPYLSGKPKQVAERVESALDVIEKSELGSNLAQHMTAGDMKALLADVIGAGLSDMTATEFGATVAALVGMVGAETGPADLALLSLAGAGAYAAYYTFPTDEVANTIAGAIVDTIESLAGH